MVDSFSGCYLRVIYRVSSGYLQDKEVPKSRNVRSVKKISIKILYCAAKKTRENLVE
jgi:hypothetical protein